MKKRSASRSAFFNPRVLIGFVLCSAGVFLALLGFGAFSAFAASMAQAQQKPKIITNSTHPLVPNGLDCSKIYELGIHKQENFRAGAIMIACGEAEGGSPTPSGETSQFVQELLSPLFGTADVDLVTGTETSPHITQSETFVAANPDNPDEIVVAYNDSRGVFASPINISGASVSTDGGNTFTRLTKTDGQSPFANTLGDPVILYNRPTGTWFTVWLDAACGGQGLGGYKSTNPSDPNSWTHYTCVHNNSSDDRESGWADNNPSSPFYGRMYVSWNDFQVGGGALFVRYSTDNGVTWSNSRQITTGSPFIRNVQITGDSATGDVYVAGMDEGGGGLTNRSNKIYRSTDGGNSWTNTYTGPAFPGPGRTTCPNAYFTCMYTDTGGYWRHMGWGQPAALNGLVHYVYDSRNTGNGDPANVFYIRSTDGGVTFGPPVQLNTDTTTRAQWQPNLSVSPTGTLLAVWYDERETANCSKGNAGVPCYRMWARKSVDNGATWLPDEPFSDVVTPLPGQPDPGIIAEYAGDYDYGVAIATKHLSAWNDGRVTISGQSQQDAFTDRELVGLGELTLESSFSRKTDRHNSFDVPLPGVEDRSDGKRFVIGFTFNNNVTGADSATTSCGTIGSVSIDPNDAHTLLVTFNGQTCNQQNVTITAINVHDDLGNTLASAETSGCFLIGDVNGDGHVGNGDIGNIQGHLGEGTDSTNFRDDINADGRINNQDVQAARAHRREFCQ
jgi:hypothetical protein